MERGGTSSTFAVRALVRRQRRGRGRGRAGQVLLVLALLTVLLAPGGGSGRRMAEAAPAAQASGVVVYGQLAFRRLPPPAAAAYITDLAVRIFPPDSYRAAAGQPDSRAPLATAAARTDSSGTFTATLPGLAPGAYAVQVKPEHALSIEVSRMELAASAPAVPITFGSPREGDVNGDDAVTIQDLSILAASFNRSAGQPGFDRRADLNQDGAVTILDFSLLVGEFNRRGPLLPTCATTAGTGEPALDPMRDAYGVILSGSSLGSEAELRTLLDKLRLRSWFMFGQSDVNSACYAQVLLVNVKNGVLSPDAASLRTRAARWPGSYWLIGNEPNVGGQDNVAADVYARLFREARDALRGADPGAKLVAPNVLNWETLCYGTCGWSYKGRQFVEDFRQEYRRAYGTEPPVDVWGIHAYDLNWGDLPMDNYAAAQTDLTAARAYLDAIPEQRGKPIWVTELGIIWSYSGLEFRPVNPPGCTSPVGSSSDGRPICLEPRPADSYRIDLVLSYIRQITGWLEQNRAALGIQRWFLYASYPPPEVYSSTPTTIRLLDGPTPAAGLSESGRAYAGLR